MTDTTEDYLVIKNAVREQADDVVLNFSTGASLGDASLDDRRQALAAAPEVATLNCGSMNLGAGADVLMNPRSLIDELAHEMRQRQIVPEYECFDLGMVLTAAGLAGASPADERTAGPGMIHMVLGLAGGAPANPATVSLFAQLVPPGVPWALTAIHRHFPLMGVALALGGHIRTGLEDVAQLAPGVYAESNAQLVRRAKALCEAVGRAVATPAQAREVLGIGEAGGAWSSGV